MTFDDEIHKQIVISLIDQGQFQGALAEQVVELKNAVKTAKVEKPSSPDDTQYRTQ